MCEPRVRRARCPLCGVRDVITGWVLCPACDPWPLPPVTLCARLPTFHPECYGRPSPILTVARFPRAVRMRARLAADDPGNGWDDIVRVLEDYREE